MDTLRIRILNAGDVCVRELIAEHVAVRIPRFLRDAFLGMRVRWSDDRAWGHSFRLGDDDVRLGHRRGDHIATRPWVHGLTEGDAEEVLRLALEGTALHELGHAVLDAYSQCAGVDFESYLQGLAASFVADGPVSSYFGHGPHGSDEDALHEMYAEAFRYFVADETLERTHPTVFHAVALSVRALEADHDR